MHLPMTAWGQGPFWATWPFTPGYGDLYSTLAKFVLAAVCLGLIVIFLRALYGPKGLFRDKDMDRESEEARRAELKELERAYTAGEISELDYIYRKKSLLN